MRQTPPPALPQTRLIRPLFAFLSVLGLALLAIPILVLLSYGVTAGGWQNLPQPAIVLSALGLSLRTSFVSLVCIALLGAPLAYTLARVPFRGKRIANLFIELPIVMPPAVAGLALLLTFGRRGLLGMPLNALGITIAFSELAVILAQTFVAAPLFIRAAEIGFAGVPRDLEDAARVDGATDGQVFWRITFPLAAPALFSGIIVAWARAIGEFGATILFAGSLQGVTQTMPLLVYGVFERDINAAVWTSLLLIAMALLALMLSQWIQRRALYDVASA